MVRVFGHYISAEMFLLWLIEFVLCFLAFSVLLSVTAAATGHVVPIHSPRTASFAAILALTIGLASIAGGLYRPETCCAVRALAINTAVAGTLAFPAVLAISKVVGLKIGELAIHDPRALAEILFAWIFCLVLTRTAFRIAIQLDLFARRLFVVGSDSAALRVREVVAAAAGPVFSLVDIAAEERGLPSPERLRELKIWAIVVTTTARPRIAAAGLLRCKAEGVHIFNDVEFRERQLRRVDIDHLGPDWLAFAEGFSCGRLSSTLRRAADALVSSALLLFFLPLMLLTALLIKIEGPGPILYRQERVGRLGKNFILLKFRSMLPDAENGHGPAWATKNDPRVTRVGRIIRLLRIDEMPQLLNVLKGEMSLIGPRPERPYFVEQLTRAIPGYSDRHWVKPGITGWAQVNFPYGASVDDARMKLAYDLYYLKHRGLFLDLLILISTVRVVLLQEGSR